MIPDSTALVPAVRLTVMGRVVPAATLIGTETHAPWLKLPPVRLAVCVPTVIVSRRAVESQSNAYRCRLPWYAFAK